MMSILLICLRHKIYSHCIIPGVKYSCRAWKLTKSLEKKLWLMERAIIGITCKWLREQGNRYRSY